MPIPVPELNNRAVRKWPNQKLVLFDDNAEFPAELFGVDHLPVAVPSGGVDMGYITTDGVSTTNSVSSEGTNMLQTLEEVRVDLTGRTRSLTVAFGESNAYTRALRAGLPVADFPVDKYGPTDLTEGGDQDVSDFPYYRALLYKIDGVGASAVYGVEAFYRIKPTSFTDRVRSRTAVDTVGVTFGLYRDATYGTLRDAEDGPGISQQSTLPQVLAVSPSGATVGDLVKISGVHIGTATAITFGVEAVDPGLFQIDDASTIYAAIPDGLAPGDHAVVVTTPAGASLPVAYTVA